MIKGSAVLMKYLKPAFSCTEDSAHGVFTPEEREYRHQIWDMQCRLYNDEFERNQDHFSKKIIALNTADSLHDAFLQSVTVIRGKKANRIDLEFVFYHKYKDKTVTIAYRDVKRIIGSLDIEQYTPVGDYLYGEFLYENGLYSHNFVLIFDSEINISCKKIVVK